MAAWNAFIHGKQCLSAGRRLLDSCPFSIPHSVAVLSAVRTCHTCSPEGSAPHHISCILNSLQVDMEVAPIPARPTQAGLLWRTGG